MKKIASVFLVSVMIFGASCMIYTDKPPPRTISEQVLSKENGEPVPYAVLLFYSGRKSLGLSTNYGIDATAETNREGKFVLEDAQLNSKVTVMVCKGGKFQPFELPPFPESNMIDGLVWHIEYTGESGQ